MAAHRLLALRDNLVAALAGMSRAEGYQLDYGPVRTGGVDAAFDDASDPKWRPPIFVVWAGEVEQDAIAGGEMATQRFRHYSRFAVVVPIVAEDKDHDARAWQVEQDIHRALIAGDSRARGSGGRSTTYHQTTNWGGNDNGGILECVVVIRWDHVSGDMTAE